MKDEKQRMLLALQREYLEKTLEHIDEMLNLADVLATTDDVHMIHELRSKIATLDAKADENYKIACDIENAIKR